MNYFLLQQHCNDATDMELPSVMTCANYLKLPAYSSKVLLSQTGLWLMIGSYEP